MQATGSWPLFLLSLLSLFYTDPSLAFSLKHCTISYPENLINVSISCSNRYLLMIPDDIPKNTTSLDLSSNQIWNITTTDLRGLSRLIILEASRNLLSHIDDGAFTDLAMLNVLILSANRFTELTSNMFLGLSNLVSLRLDMNHISHINPLTFQPLVNIKEVILGTNSLRHITDIAPLFKLPSLHILDLSNNWLNICFQLDDLHLNVSNLRVLDLSMTQLKKFSIKKDIFPHLQTLRLLNSGDDMEWDVSNKMFLRSLTTLLVSGTSITFESYTAMLQTADSLHELRLSFVEEFIPKGLIGIGCQIRSVRTLDLNYAVIHTVDDNLLRSCSQLTKLILSFNYLPDISEHSLTSLTKLRHLELDYNYLSKVPLALRGLSTLEKLNLNVNLIMELDCLDFQNLTRLTSLSLNNNHISKLQGCVFESLNNLKVLNIKKNSIFVFDNTFRVSLWKLESLDLRKNGLLKITQGEFRNLSSLWFLDLESDIQYDLSDWAFEGLNNLRTMVVSLANYYNDPFKGLTQLENLTLHLHQNWLRRNSQQNAEPPFYYLPNLKTLVLKAHDKKQHFCEPELFMGLKSLESLVADKFFNCIRSIHPDTFKYTPKLMNLQMIHCNLSYLNPALFWPIPNLQELDLSNNNFKSLDFLVQANMRALRWFKFSGNKLSIINEKVFDSLPALRYLDLNDNTLICECSNSGFYKWVLSNNEVQVVDGHQYNCAFPVSKQGTKFLDFDINSCWVDVSFLCFISSSSLVLLILLTSFIYHFLRWHLTYAYYLFLAFLYDKKKKRGTPHQFDAFVSYNIHNEDWVYKELLPELEGQQGWRLCLHHRDFEPGKPIVENITDAIYGSRKTICVISQQYLQSEWCSKEIQMASFRLFDEQEDVLILLFLEDIPSWQLTVYYRMRSLVKKFTYLSWPKARQHTGVFWMNMRRALETDTS